MMDDAQFWKLIDDARVEAMKQWDPDEHDIIDVQEIYLEAALKKLDIDDVLAFDERFWDYHRKAFRWDIWGAAYWANAGCNDSEFDDFRASMISIGKKYYLQILENPDSLADLVDLPEVPFMITRGFQSVAGRVYKAATGRQIPYITPYSGTIDPVGEPIDFEDEAVMTKRFPKIVAKYPNMGL